MCLTAVEILFFIAGLWMVFSGKVPEKLFKVLFGRGQYVITPPKARWFGLVLAAPFPVVMAVTLLMRAVLGEDSLGYSVFFETFCVIVVAVIAMVVARKIRQPEAAPQAVVENITS